jgi:hypothetical protein
MPPVNPLKAPPFNWSVNCARAGIAAIVTTTAAAAIFLAVIGMQVPPVETPVGKIRHPTCIGQ